MSKLFNLKKLLKIFDNDSYNLLGRWCHKGIPLCNDKVIEQKIKFALLDNSLCTKNKEYTKKK